MAPWVYALSLAWWAASWNLRNSVLMSWSPLDPVWVGAGAVALCVVHRCGRSIRVAPAVVWPLALLVLGFLPGALVSSSTGYGPAKVSTMVFVILPAVCAAIVLLDSGAARRGWVGAQVLVGLAVVAASLVFNDASQLTEPGRFTLATVDTITTARFVGVAFVGLALLGLMSRRKLWWALPLAAVCAMVLVHIGSRGPSLSAIVAVLVVVVAGRTFARHRLVLVPAMLVFAGAVYWYANVDGGSGGSRIVRSLLTDDVRARLRADAIRLGLEHPFGVGWGDFAAHSKTAHEIANAQGVAYAHNAFAEAFAEGGLLALVAFLVVVVLALYRLQRRSGGPYEAVVLGTAVYWLLNAQVSSDLIGNRFMWISIAVGLASYVDPRVRAAPDIPQKPISRQRLGQDSR